MSNIPEKCSRCGAPISWEVGASTVKCEYCGYKNNLKPNFLNFKVNKEIQDKINKIYLPAKTLLRKKYVKVILLSSLVSIFGLSLNEAINDPVNPYKTEIKEVCSKASSYEKSNFAAKNVFKDCSKFFSKTIYSLDKITRKREYPFKKSPNVNTKSFEKLQKNVLVKQKKNLWSCSKDEDCDASMRYISGQKGNYYAGIISYRIPQKYKKKFITNDCKDIKSLAFEMNKLIDFKKENPEPFKAAFLKELEGLKLEEGEDPFGSSKEWKKWNGKKIRLMQNARNIKRKNPYLKEIADYYFLDGRKAVTKKSCVKHLTNKIINSDK